MAPNPGPASDGAPSSAAAGNVARPYRRYEEQGDREYSDGVGIAHGEAVAEQREIRHHQSCPGWPVGVAGRAAAGARLRLETRPAIRRPRGRRPSPLPILPGSDEPGQSVTAAAPGGIAETPPTAAAPKASAGLARPSGHHRSRLTPSGASTGTPGRLAEFVTAILEFVRREVKRLFFNEAPVAALTLNSQIEPGTVTGSLNVGSRRRSAGLQPDPASRERNRGHRS